MWAPHWSSYGPGTTAQGLCWGAHHLGLILGPLLTVTGVTGLVSQLFIWKVGGLLPLSRVGGAGRLDVEIGVWVVPSW